MPQSRAEEYYAYLTGVSMTYPDVPQSRIEIYLHYLCEHGVSGAFTPEEVAALKRVLNEHDQMAADIQELKDLAEQIGYQIQRDPGGLYINVEDPIDPHVRYLTLNDDPDGSSLMIDTGTAVYGTNDITGGSDSNIYEIRR